MSEQTQPTQDTYAFSADISQLLSLIINTFYSNKEIFLRELISNSSDALDKIRYESLTDSTAFDSEKELKIEIIPDKNNNTLTIRDTGIGMTKNDLINNLGTIAKSGTKSFMEALANGSSDLSMIGQFGVGFYSSYLVAQKVVVHSKNNNDAQYIWESTAGGSFSVKPDSDYEKLNRGTSIVLHLKDDMKEYLEIQRLKDLVKKHSEFINFPIYLWTEKTKEEEVEESDQTSTDVENKVEDVTTPKEKKTIKTSYSEFDQLNNQKPIWMYKKEELTDEDYKSFYNTLNGNSSWDTYCHVEHFSVEGQIEFKSILFTPERAPFEMFNNSKEKKNNVKLYVRRVFITDECENLLPDYLSFIKGIVDSEDLPLNISREILQENKILGVIKKNLTKRCINMFLEIANDNDKYLKFYKQFSKNIKLGVYEDSTNRQKLSKLLRFESSKSNGGFVSLDEYIDRMSESQEYIYYITGESKEAVENSPFIEKLRSKNCEVLFMIDPMDEYAMQQLKEYENKKFNCVTKEGLKFSETDSEKKLFEESKTALESFCTFIKEVLGDKTDRVVISNRLSESPCVLVTSEYGWSANMERILKSQTLGSHMTPVMNTSKTLEINPSHRIIKSLNEKFNNDKNDKSLKDLIWLLYDVSIITSGFSLGEPIKFGSRIHKLIEIGLDCYSDDSEDNENISKFPLEEGITNVETNMEQVD
jgi:molecular chaperone HtpG